MDTPPYELVMTCAAVEQLWCFFRQLNKYIMDYISSSSCLHCTSEVFSPLMSAQKFSLFLACCGAGRQTSVLQLWLLEKMPFFLKLLTSLKPYDLRSIKRVKDDGEDSLHWPHISVTQWCTQYLIYHVCPLGDIPNLHTSFNSNQVSYIDGIFYLTKIPLLSNVLKSSMF